VNAARIAQALLTVGIAGVGDRLQSAGTVGYHGYQLVMIPCAGMLAIAVLDQRRNALVRLLERRSIVWAGVISSSVFLWHVPVLTWLERHGALRHGLGGVARNLALTATLTAAAAVLTWRLVERPALSAKRRPRTRPDTIVEPGLAEAAP
jgi:peptidoglycan/LPS O-acetylase OafA/YrhL